MWETLNFNIILVHNRAIGSESGKKLREIFYDNYE
jgi:hypothetical protein